MRPYREANARQNGAKPSPPEEKLPARNPPCESSRIEKSGRPAGLRFPKSSLRFSVRRFVPCIYRRHQRLRPVPHTTLEIPDTTRRLDRIQALLHECRYSIHNLSRVELSRTTPRTPHFKMPFELGLAVSWTSMNPGRHSWFVCDSVYRSQRNSAPNPEQGRISQPLRAADIRGPLLCRYRPGPVNDD